MSLDMTVETRGLGVVADDEDLPQIEAAPLPRLWLQDLMVGAAAAFGAVLSSVVGVLLFLR